MEVNPKSDRGRVYECTQCSFLGERKMAIKHYQKHFSSEEHQFRCRLCGFSSSDKQMFKRHSSFYTSHNQQKAQLVSSGLYLGSDDQYVVTNPTPRTVNPDIDLKRWEAEPSAKHWLSKRKTSMPAPAAVITPLQQPVSSSITNTSTTTQTVSTVTTAMPSVSIIPSIHPAFISTASTTCLSPATPTVTDSRIIVDTNIADSIISLSENMERPLPLRSPPCTVPRPILPDIVLPNTDDNIIEDILPQLLENDTLTDEQYPTLQSAFSALIEVMKEHNTILTDMKKEQHDLLTDIKKQLVKNHDQMEKVEIAIRRSNQPVPPPPRTPPRRRLSYNSYNRPPLKRRFIPERSVSVSPVKKVKSSVKKSSPKKK